MQAQPILSCQYASWYRQFGHLAFKSKLIELPQDFTGFLLQDGVFLSESSSAVSIQSCIYCPFHLAYRSMRVVRKSSP